MRSTRSSKDGARVPDPLILTPPAGQSRDLRATPSLNVGEGGLWQAVTLGGGQEGSDHGLAGDPSVGQGGEQVAGVVIQPVDDLHASAVGQLPVGEVGLPALVGLVGLESPVGAFGSLLRFRGDQPGGGEDAADGGESRWPQALLL
jgi:hypothetical protein